MKQKFYICKVLRRSLADFLYERQYDEMAAQATRNRRAHKY